MIGARSIALLRYRWQTFEVVRYTLAAPWETEKRGLFDWLTDPTAWLGLATLVVLEIVLGIDNLIFIAILSDKLPAHQRNNARRLGLGLALFMRLGLLASISWIVGLTAPVLNLWRLELSWRDIILITGGLFLLIKATIEIHDRLEISSPEHRPGGGGRFWPIIAQIVALDAVFSIDSVITAIGLAEQLSVMVIAIVVAVGVMMLSARAIGDFVERHPTIKMLALSFLLLIGTTLVADGLGFHFPKGYVYVAMAFSAFVEMLNIRVRRHAMARGGGP